jgi:hypothetical protein
LIFLPFFPIQKENYKRKIGFFLLENEKKKKKKKLKRKDLLKVFSKMNYDNKDILDEKVS